MLNRSASLAMSTSVLKALPGKLDIKRHSPSILYICGYWRAQGLRVAMFLDDGIGVDFHTLVNVYVDLVVFTRIAGTS